MQVSNLLKADTPQEKFNDAVNEIMEHAKSNWECVSSENGTYRISFTKLIKSFCWLRKLYTLSNLPCGRNGIVLMQIQN